MSNETFDIAITLVRNEREASLLDAHDLKVLHTQLNTDKRSRPWANPQSEAGKLRNFVEVPVERKDKTLFKVVYYNQSDMDKVAAGVKEHLSLYWVKLAQVEEFAG